MIGILQYIALEHEVIKTCMVLYCMIFISIKWNDIKQIACSEDGRMSSKRIIALMGMGTLCRLAIYTTNPGDDVDNNILIVLTVIVLTASAIATFPQIMSLVGKIKGIATKEEKTVNLNKSDVQITASPGKEDSSDNPQTERRNDAQ